MAQGLLAGADAVVEALRSIKEETGRAAEAYRAVVRSLALAGAQRRRRLSSERHPPATCLGRGSSPVWPYSVS